MTTMRLSRFILGPSASIATLISLVILIGLGTWQASKVGPKTALIQKIVAGLAETPKTLPVHLDNPAAVEYQRFMFEGQLLDKEPLAVFGTNMKGTGGYQLYMPVKSRFGPIVIVNFGWVPKKNWLELNLPLEQYFAVSGVLRLNAQPGSFSVPNSVADRVFYTADVDDMAASWGLASKDYYHFRLIADHRGAPDDLPQGSQIRLDIPNNHFQYALTWYGIALSLLGVYIAAAIKNVRGKA